MLGERDTADEAQPTNNQPTVRAQRQARELGRDELEGRLLDALAAMRAALLELEWRSADFRAKEGERSLRSARLEMTAGLLRDTMVSVRKRLHDVH